MLKGNEYKVFRRSKKVFCLVTTWCYCAVVFAQSDSLSSVETAKNDTTSLAEVSVLGYSATQLANRQAYNVVAIDAKRFHNTTSDIARVLDRTPGARLRETGGVGSDFDLSINGFSGKRIRYFLDGVPMDNFGPSFQINNIPVNLAERIEVYKGVVPVWLGSDALGGAVNIITDKRMKNYIDASYSYGSFNTHRTNINAAITSKNGFTVQLNAFQNYSDNNYKVTVDAADIRTGKYYPNSVLKRFHDQYHNETAITKIGFVDKAWADQLLVGMTLGQYYKEIQTGAQLSTVYGAWHTRGNIIMPTLKYQKKDLFTEGLNVTVNANYNLGKEQNIDTVHARFGWLGDTVVYRGKGGEQWYSHYVYRNNTANTSATATYRINDKQLLALNNVYSHFDRKGDNLVSPNERQYRVPQKTNKNILGLSYQYTIADKWSATLFGKYTTQTAKTTLITTVPGNALDTIYTDVDADRNKLGYGIAATYFVKPHFQVKASYEKTNRMPESEDIFGDVTNKEANWEIRPESSDNLNIGLNYTHSFARHHRVYVSATRIYYYAKDFIYNAFNNVENKIIARNLLQVSNTGLESEIRYAYKDMLSIGANMTSQNIRDRQKYRGDLPVDAQIKSDTYKERIPNIPYLFGNADASIFLKNVFDKADRLSIGYNILYVHAFYLYWAKDGAAETKRVIPRQRAQDVHITYALKGGKYNLSLECKNLTNNRLYDNFSLQKPGRAYYVKWRYFIHK